MFKMYERLHTASEVEPKNFGFITRREMGCVFD
jgi:hypothetical protein